MSFCFSLGVQSTSSTHISLLNRVFSPYKCWKHMDNFSLSYRNFSQMQSHRFLWKPLSGSREKETMAIIFAMKVLCIGVFSGACFMCWGSWRTGTIHVHERKTGIIVNNWKHSLRVLMILQTLAIRCRLLEAGDSAGSSGGDRGSGTRNTAAVFSFEKQGLLQGQV